MSSNNKKMTKKTELYRKAISLGFLPKNYSNATIVSLTNFINNHSYKDYHVSVTVTIKNSWLAGQKEAIRRGITQGSFLFSDSHIEIVNIDMKSHSTPTRSEMKEAVIQHLSDEYDDEYEGEYLINGDTTFKFSNFHVVSADSIQNNYQDIRNIRRKNATFVKHTCIPCDFDYIIEENKGLCVPASIERYYSSDKRFNNAKKTLNIDNIYNVFLEYDDIQKNKNKEYIVSNNVYDGFSMEHVKYFCQKYDIAMYCYDIQNNIVDKIYSKNRNHKALVFYISGEHFYIISDENIKNNLIRTESVKDNKHTSTLVRDNEKKGFNNIIDSPSIDELKTLSNCTVIMDNCNDLRWLLYELLETEGFLYDKGLRLDCKGNTSHITGFIFNNNVRVLSNPNYNPMKQQHVSFKTIQELCNKIGCPFTNQSLCQISASLSSFWFSKCKSNKLINDETKLKLLKKNKYCSINNCLLGNDMSKCHFIHKQLLSEGGENNENNIKIICNDCFLNEYSKNDQNEYIKNNPMSSSFNSYVREEIINKNKHWSFIEKIGTQRQGSKLFTIDHTKCRSNILAYSKYDFPVFSIMDSPCEFSGEFNSTCGLYYIETNNNFPFRGNGWYYYPLIKQAIRNKIISLNNIKYELIPSNSISNEQFRKFKEWVYMMFDNNISKRIINILIGYWAITKTNRATTIFTDNFSEMSYFYTKFKESDCTNYITKNEKLQLWELTKSESYDKIDLYTPLYNFIIDCEIMHMLKLSNIIKKKGGNIIYANTDSITYDIFDSEIDISVYHWDSDKKIPKYKYEKPKDDYTRVVQRMGYTIRTEKFVLNDFKYNNIYVDNESDDFSKIADITINSNKGCRIIGHAGTGKSSLIKELKKKLDKLGLSYKCICPTNASARIIDGETIHKFIIKTFSSNNCILGQAKSLDYLFIDEISMISCEFWNAINILKLYNNKLKIILSGDFDQLLVFNSEGHNFNYENSRIIAELSDFNQIELTKCRRSNNDGKELFNICNNIISKQSYDVTKCVPKTDCDFNIAVSNKKRCEVNEQCMKRYINNNPKLNSIFIANNTTDDNAQDITLMVGMPVICKKNLKSLNIFNNYWLSVTSINDDKITMKVDNTDDVIIIDANTFHNSFRLGFCVTSYSSQGMTINKDYGIYEWRKMNNRHRYVCLSRSSKLKYIHIN